MNEELESLRPLLHTYAYNILGSYEDARDIVQDAYLNYMKSGNEEVANPKAYLTRSVINLSINLKNRHHHRFSNYPGEWLPEPIATETADKAVIMEDILSYSLLVLLEKLNAKQRAVFILKEAFDYDHEEIAAALGVTVDNSRKLLSRAKEQLQQPSTITDRKAPRDYLVKYMDIIRAADTNRLEQMLTEEITVISDGGGKAVAFINPIHGKKSVSALLMGIYHKYYSTITIEMGQVNREPALFYYDNNKLITCQIFIIHNDIISNVYFIRNPDKLKELQKNP